MSKPWYSSGLNFHCTGCGKCCTGSPGYVWLKEEDIQRLADHLNLSIQDFLTKHTRKVGARRSLLEDSFSYDCEFFKDNRCTVYDSRPTQCRTYPFWDSVLESPTSWETEKHYCEGIEHPDSKSFSLEEIEEQRSK